MDDLISRQAAIDALEAKKDKSAKGYVVRFYNAIIQNNIDALKGLPSAQPERKKGKWIKRGPSLYKCSECARFSPTQENFCPKCGTEMEKADEC